MLRRNRTDKTPATHIATKVALGQFLKVCSIVLPARSLRFASLASHTASAVIVEDVGIPLCELANIRPEMRRPGTQD
jgi:hypothetical protein